jgi:hypothetical protein
VNFAISGNRSSPAVSDDKEGTEMKQSVLEKENVRNKLVRLLKESLG